MLVVIVVVVVVACDVDELPTQILDLDCLPKQIASPARYRCCALFEMAPLCDCDGKVGD